MSASNSRPSIAIIGGGPSGLCLSVLLHKHGIPFTLYELRDKPSDSALLTPSGMLDLHQESGLAAIRACGLWDDFQKHILDCSEELIVMDKHARVTHRDSGGPGPQSRPEIARNTLTHLLLASVPAERIRWECKLLSACRTSTNRISLDFGAKGIFEHDFVVGADGAWSKIRSLITTVQPYYGGIQYLTLDILNATTRYPPLSTLVGSGSCFILGSKRGVVTHRGVQNSIRLYIGVSTEDETPFYTPSANLEVNNLKKGLVYSPELFGTWSDEVKDLISTAVDETLVAADTNQIFEPKPLYMLPIGHKWEAQPGVAIIGDAAHLMMPWAGEGVNLALWDSLDLANTIIQSWDQAENTAEFQRIMTPLVSEFEKKMFERSKRAAEETWQNSKMLFSDNGAQAMGDMMAAFQQMADFGKGNPI
ncbi:salicylate hydroxylase [Trichoderma velutinum]